MAGIRVSKKHGVNPSLSTCAWCGKEKNEIVLMGYLKGDVEAPRKAVFNYDPCDECKESWSQGVAVIEVVRETLPDRLPIATDAYPTGRMVVVKPSVFGDKYKAGQVVFALKEDFDSIFGPNL